LYGRKLNALLTKLFDNSTHLPENKETKKQHVKLTPKDREYLESLISKGKLSAKMFRRANGLLELDRGKTLLAVAKTLGVNYVTIAAWRDGYK
jgi:putative transposase